MMNEDFLKNYLEQRKKAGTLRQLPQGDSGIDFLSNDYLGLSRNSELLARIDEKWSSDQRRQLGGTGSRLLSGNHPHYEELEALLSSLFQAEAVLVFNSGYQANQSLISAVAGKDDVVLYDELAHVCLKEGAWLSRARTFSFRHNDVEDLRRRLANLRVPGSRLFVVTESLFSMDGDFAPIEDILDVCEECDAYVIVDEAHSSGVYGEQGAGWLVEQGLHQRIFGRVYTFGKALGSHGACVAGSQLLRDFLINAGRSFIYTTSLPPHSVRTLIESFRYVAEHPKLAEDLMANVKCFRSTYHEHFGALPTSHSAIQPIAISGAGTCLKVASSLQEAGFDVMAIRAPTVRAGSERLRISLHAHNRPEEVGQLLDHLKLLTSKMQVGHSTIRG